MSVNLDLGGVGQGGAWITVNNDASGYRPRPDYVLDITEAAFQLHTYWPFGTVEAIRCIHTLEHLPAYQILPTLTYWKRLLRDGAPLLLVVPDLGKLAKMYAVGTIPFDVFAAVAYVPATRTVHGAGEEHRWGWDWHTMVRDLDRAGFSRFEHPPERVWPESWTLDFDDLRHTGCVGTLQIPNLRIVAR